MKKTILSIALLNGIASFANAAYTGHVFVDKNNNGVFDKGEKAMAGILVSDGLNVVKTAGDGSFTLPGHERERFILLPPLLAIKQTISIITVSMATKSRTTSDCNRTAVVSNLTVVINMCISLIQRYSTPTIMVIGYPTFVITRLMRKLLLSSIPAISVMRTV